MDDERAKQTGQRNLTDGRGAFVYATDELD